MVKNLLQTGTVFNYSANDKSYADDLLNLDISDTIEVKDEPDTSDKTFEDED